MTCLLDNFLKTWYSWFLKILNLCGITSNSKWVTFLCDLKYKHERWWTHVTKVSKLNAKKLIYHMSKSLHYILHAQYVHCSKWIQAFSCLVSSNVHQEPLDQIGSNYDSNTITLWWNLSFILFNLHFAFFFLCNYVHSLL